MEFQDKKLSKFMQAINRDAEERRARILSEAEEFNKAELEKAETEALTDAYHIIQEETAHMRLAIRRETSQEYLDLYRSALKKRGEIMDGVFAQTAKELIAFTRSPDYKGMLVRAAREAAAVLPSDKAIVVRLRAGDTWITEEIRQVFGDRCTFAEDESIVIGGAKFSCEAAGITVDETFDSRLDAQKLWFAEHSGLTVQIS